MIRGVIVAVCLAVAAGPAVAQHMDKALFLDIATGDDTDAHALLLIYLQGALNGLESANTELIRRGDRRLFCAPRDRILQPDWLMAELVVYLKRYPKIPDNTAVTVIAGKLLMELFPCEQRLSGPVIRRPK